MSHPTFTWGVGITFGISSSGWYKRLFLFFGQHNTEGEGGFFAATTTDSDTLPESSLWTKI